MLNEKVNDLIKQLMCYLYDSHSGYNECAKNTENQQLKKLFLELSEQRSMMRQRIKDIISISVQDLPVNGTTSGYIHRIFLNLKSLLTNNNEDAIVAEIKKGENYLIEIYIKLLKNSLPVDLVHLLTEQLKKIENDVVEIDLKRTKQPFL